MPKTSRHSTTFQHPIFGTVDNNLISVFKCDNEVCGKEVPHGKYVLRHVTEWYTDTLLISLTEDIKWHEDICEIYNRCLKIKEEKAKDDAMWQEILTNIAAPDFIERSPSPDCNSEPDPKRRRVLA